MIDSRLKPWLIEVNGGPSMTANTEFDFQLKCGLVDDVLSIIDLEGILGGEEMTIGGFDLIMKKDIPVRSHRFL
jgi:tubulin polyglutamylase TTLL9